MAGIRIGGVASIPVPVCSPPFTNTDVGATDSVQVFRSCSGDPAGNATQITSFTDGRTVEEDACNPMLSPDGTKILFEVLNNSNDWEIWVVNSTPGSIATKVVGVLNEHYYYPSWGPDSDTFTYVKGTEARNDGGPYTIFTDVVSAPGSPVTVVSIASGTANYLARPRFNFDGTRIAYMQQLTFAKTIRCCDADGTNDASIDTISNYDAGDPPCLSWANTQNLICWQDGSTHLYVADDTGAGRVQINASGDSAGLPPNVSHLAWPADDSFVMYSAVQASTRCGIFLGQLDGSGAVDINPSVGATNNTYLRTPLIFNDRVWFIEFVSGGANGLSSMLLDGSDYQNNLDVSLGAPDLEVFTASEWGFYFN